MAVASSPASKSNLSSPKSKKKKEPETEKLPECGSPNPKPPAKRTKAPGVRVVHGRIYDSQNGKTCHQCRQKTLDFCADCKNCIRDKQCTLKFCHTCLLNRYGEKAEEVALLEDWSCPRCRGICNCSLCMKKRGHQPTGMLVRTAKASGFSSVSDLLHVKGSEIIGPYTSTKEMGASPRKLAAVDEQESKIVSPRKLGKENLFEGKMDVNLTLPSASSLAKEKTKKMKKGSKEMHEVNGDNTLSKESDSSPTVKKRKNMKPEVSKEITDGTLQKEISPHPDEKKLKKKMKKGSKEMHEVNGDNTLSKESDSSPTVKKRKNMKPEVSKEITDGTLQKEISLHPDEKKLKKKMKKGPKEMHEVNGDNTLLKESDSSPTVKKRKNMKPEVSKEITDGTLQKEISPHPDEKKLKKMPKEMVDAERHAEGHRGTHINEVTRKSPRINKINRVTVGNLKEAKTTKEANGVRQDEMVSKKRIHKEVDDMENNIQKSVEVLDSVEHQNENQNKVVMEYFLDAHEKCLDDDIPLPTGTELTTVAGIDLPAQDVGHALQFLEFCAAFGKILDVKKGHAEAILRELINGRNTRRGKSTLIVQFQIQLLSLIQKDSGSPPLSESDEKSSWLSVLKECLQDSYCPLDSLPLHRLDKVLGGYDSLDSSMKLRLLNFLCDEVLETAELRTWIEDQSSKFAEETKEAKARVIAAKQKEKLLQHQMRDDIAKAVVAKNGAPLSISEHEAIVSQIKQKAAQAHAETLDSKSMVSKDQQISEVVRTEAVHLDSNGCVYWRLKGYSDRLEILGQDIRSRDGVNPEEKWFTYDAEQTNLIEKKIKSSSNMERRIRRKIQFTGMTLPMENKDAILS